MKREQQLMCGFRMMNGKWNVIRFTSSKKTEKPSMLDDWIRNMDLCLRNRPVPQDLSREIEDVVM